MSLQNTFQHSNFIHSYSTLNVRTKINYENELSSQGIRSENSDVRKPITSHIFIMV